MKLVIFPAVEEQRLERIREAAGSMQVVNAANESEAASAVVDAEAFFGKLTPALLSVAKRLRWVQTPTASLEHYMFPQLVEHPSVLTNMRGLFSDVIADHVFAYILCFARNLHRYLQNQRQRLWEPCGGEQARSDFISGPGVVSAMDRAHMHVSDCTLGVVGFGAIGAEVARRGTAFGMRVLGVDVAPKTPPEGVEAVWPLAELPRLLAESDFVVIAAPHTPQTAGMFGAEQFRQMKSSGCLINIGRGAIVRLADLTAALATGAIAGAALDVFEAEPLPTDHPLWEMENVIITPHVAAASPRIAERHLQVLLTNISHFVNNEPLINVADKANWF